MSSTRVFQLQPNQIKHLENFTTEHNLEVNSGPYIQLQFKLPSVHVTLYTSGKLVVQGKGSQEWIEFTLEPQILKNFNSTIPQEFQHEIHMNMLGSDEAGKGDYFGPLCVACVYLTQEASLKLFQEGVKDCKQLNDKKIRQLAPIIRKTCPYEEIVLNPLTYNRLYEKIQNLNSLLTWAHKTVIENLLQRLNITPEIVLVDQFAKTEYWLEQLSHKYPTITFKQKPRAEEYLSVASASILARDSFLTNLEKLGNSINYPLPKGAGPKVDLAAKQLLQSHGSASLKQWVKWHFANTKKVLHSP